MSDRPITLAVIVGAHGVTGEVRVKLFGSGLDALKAHKSFNNGALTLKSLRPQKDLASRALPRFPTATPQRPHAAPSSPSPVPRSRRSARANIIMPI